MSDALYWLLNLCDSDHVVLKDINTEEQRVSFVTKATQILCSKLKIELNLKSLYIAKEEAVQELLKIATLLYTASQQRRRLVEKRVETSTNVNWSLFQHDNQRLKQLVSTLGETGLSLCNALQFEYKNKEARLRAVETVYEAEEINTSIKSMTTELETDIKKGEVRLKGLQETRQNLQIAVDGKKADLRRFERRVAALENVRPAYMDEYENLRTKQQALHVEYFQCYRNKKYLESVFEKQRAFERAMKRSEEKRIEKMQKQWKKEERQFFQETADSEEVTSLTETESNASSYQSTNQQRVEVLKLDQTEDAIIDGRRIAGNLVIDGEESEIEIEDSSEDISIDEDTESSTIAISQDKDRDQILEDTSSGEF